MKQRSEQFLPGLDPIEPEDEEEKIFVATHEKRKAKSTPINTITFSDDLSEDQKIDPVTGLTLVCIGEASSQKLAMKASSYFIKEINGAAHEIYSTALSLRVSNLQTI